MNYSQDKPPQEEPLALLAGADDSYAMPLAISLFSALDSLEPGQRVNVYIVNGGISKNNRERIEDVLFRLPVELTLEWCQPDSDVIDTLPEPSGHISLATYYRLLAPSLVRERRVIYLDSDLIVCSDLSKVWDTNLEGQAVAACPNVGIPSCLGEMSSWREQGLNPRDPYFNAGVLLMDLDKWREDNVAQSVLANITNYEGVYEFADQDGLNAVLSDNWLELNKEWNAQISNDAFDLTTTPVSEVGIIHYTGAFKPWQWQAYGKRLPYYEQFFRVLERSGWYTPLEYFGFRVNHMLTSTKALPKRLREKWRIVASRESSPLWNKNVQ
jgi:lipopolysaccharide biosynthesis glycosyltransferase